MRRVIKRDAGSIKRRDVRFHFMGLSRVCRNSAERIKRRRAFDRRAVVSLIFRVARQTERPRKASAGSAGRNELNNRAFGLVVVQQQPLANTLLAVVIFDFVEGNFQRRRSRPWARRLPALIVSRAVVDRVRRKREIARFKAAEVFAADSQFTVRAQIIRGR